MSQQLLSLATSLVTLVAMWALGRKYWWGWAVGLANQTLWIATIVLFRVWGLAPLTAALTVMYAMNLYRWRKPAPAPAEDEAELAPWLASALGADDPLIIKMREDALARIAAGLDIPPALLAVGGECAPLPPQYDVFQVTAPSVGSLLPNISAPRGGITYVRPNLDGTFTVPPVTWRHKARRRLRPVTRVWRRAESAAARLRDAGAVLAGTKSAMTDDEIDNLSEW